MKKTWKREVACLNLLGLWYLALTGSTGTLEIMVMPVFFFLALAFGMDWYGKAGSVNPFSGASGGMFRSTRNSNVAGESSTGRSSEHSDWERK